MARIPEVIYVHHFTADRGCGWFRLFGVGIVWMDTERYGELRSVIFVDKRHARWKDRRQLRIGSWRFALSTWRNP